MKLEVRTFGTPCSLTLSTVSSSILTVYKWGYFSKFQSLQSYGAIYVKSFDSTGHTFLAFANYRNETSVQGHIISTHSWNGSKFILFQSIPTRGSYALYLFTYHLRSNVHHCH